MRHKSLVRFVLMAVMFWIVSASWAAPLKPVLFYSKTEKGMGNRSYTFRFSLWDAETGGNRVWEEEKTLKAKNSVLNTYLGEVNSIEGVDFGQALWVQVEKKETDGTYEIIDERDEFTGVPFAMWALTPAGPKGDKGDKGDQGDTGPQGAQGLQGSTGPTGPQGPIGATGPVGPIGPVGPQGAIGSQGLTGPQGIQGPMGPTGPQGPKGDIGPMGLQGPDGPMGPRGMPGHAQVYDAQGQFLGLLLDFKACAYSIYLCEGNELPGTAFVISLFVPSLSKIFNLDVDTGDSVHVRVILYDADDCAGASYINGTPYEIFKLGSKYITGDIRQRATIKSIFEFNTTTTRCVASGGYEQWVATYREVALPFTTPVALPIHFVY